MLMKVLVNMCRLLLAATFIFSGFVKANDPWGMVYKFHDYLAAVNLDVLPDTFLLCSAVLLAMFEFILGCNILFCINKLRTISLATIFMGAMTLLTVYIAVENPVHDCGCFGDAIILSNSATLAKNIVLMAAVIIMGRWRKYLYNKVPESIKGLVSIAAMCGIFGYAIFCIICLPAIDFRPYKVGLDLRNAVENASATYDVKLIYEKDGKQIELSLEDDDPDSTWTYVETRRTEIESKNVATADFFVSDANGDEATDEILYADGTAFMLCIPDLTNADEGCINKVNDVYDFAIENGHSFFCLTASDSEKAQAYWKDHTGAEYDFYIADDRLLKTIVRGAPGLVMLQDGVIVKKWSNHNLPDEQELQMIIGNNN